MKKVLSILAVMATIGIGIIAYKEVTDTPVYVTNVTTIYIVNNTIVNVTSVVNTTQKPTQYSDVKGTVVS